jgi:hypothetical protein
VKGAFLMRRRLFLLALAAVPATLSAQALGEVALQGYDPVAYFTEGAPRRGLPEFDVVWEGARWHFATEANRAAFVADPAAFAPQYGGNCAWAAAHGYLADVDPSQWRIVEGRLYLNANARVQRRWERDIPDFIRAADANWPALGG